MTHPMSVEWRKVTGTIARNVTAVIHADAMADELDRLHTIESAFLNLLAVIHRDGGHYHQEHGDLKAAADAESRVIALMAENERLRAVIRRLLAVNDALMPGVKFIAVQDYAELNDAPVAARAELEPKP